MLQTHSIFSVEINPRTRLLAVPTSTRFAYSIALYLCTYTLSAQLYHDWPVHKIYIPLLCITYVETYLQSVHIQKKTTTTTYRLSDKIAVATIQYTCHRYLLRCEKILVIFYRIWLI